MRTRSEKLARVRQLRSLIAELRGELDRFEEEVLAAPEPRKVRLDRPFFWRRVFPILERFPEGLTNGEIRSRLGVMVALPAFRLFLNRHKEGGVIELVPAARGKGVWRLTPKAHEDMQTLLEGKRRTQSKSAQKIPDAEA